LLLNFRQDQNGPRPLRFFAGVKCSSGGRREPAGIESVECNVICPGLAQDIFDFGLHVVYRLIDHHARVARISGDDAEQIAAGLSVEAIGDENNDALARRLRHALDHQPDVLQESASDRAALFRR
jgi:hypothetical protein